MKKRSFVLGVVGLLIIAPAHGQLTTEEFGKKYSSESTGLSYLLYLPDNFDSKEKYPTILFLHGGDRSNTKHHPAKYAKKTGVNFPFIVIAPHCTGGCSWTSVKFNDLLSEITASTSSIDKNRLYLTGYSMGGYGSWSALSRYPQWFAAAAPIAGGGNTTSVCNAKNVPTRAYHGNKDNVINHSQSQKMIEALKECGGNAQLITYQGVDHGSWPITFRDPEFYEWLLSNSK